MTSSSLRVLLIEDSEDDALLLNRELRRYGFKPDVQRVETLGDMAAALDRSSWDIAIADWNLPRFGVLEALDLLHERRLDLPFIVISGVVAEDMAVTALRAGAQDFVRKGNWARLGPAIDRELHEAKNRRERKRADVALRFLTAASRELTESLDYTEIARNVVRLAVPTLGDWCAISIRLPGDAPIYLATACTRESLTEQVDNLARSFFLRPRGILESPELQRLGHAIVVADLSREQEHSPQLDRDHQRSFRELGGCSLIAIPLIGRGQVLGAILAVSAESGRHYDDVDRDLIDEFTQRVASVVDNALLYVAEREARAEAERAVERITRLQSITSSLSSAVTLESVTQILVDAGVAALGADAGLVAVAASDRESVEIVASTGFPTLLGDYLLGDRRNILLTVNVPTTEAVRTGRVVWVPSAKERVERFPDMRSMPFEVMVSVPLRADNEVLGALTLAFTDLRLLDRNDLDYVQTLADQCAQSFQRAKLYEAERSAVRARDEFLSVAAHELRTPLTSLALQAQLSLRRIERNGVVDADREHLAFRTINHQAAKAANLINQLLDISRIDAGKLTIHRQPADIVALVEEVARASRERAPEHIINLKADRGIVALIDALRLEQVLTNLVDNAIKYSPGGGQIELDVGTTRIDRFTISVTDHGVGIPPEHRPHIFDRFFQAHAETHLSGLGLGLFISRQIVELHGGRIWAEFPSAGGTRFVVELPVE